jgi:hypothetical protein
MQIEEQMRTHIVRLGCGTLENMTMAIDAEKFDLGIGWDRRGHHTTFTQSMGTEVTQNQRSSINTHVAILEEGQ